MTHSKPDSNNSPIAGYLVGIGFLLAAGFFVVLSPRVEVPSVDQPVILVEQITPGAFRVALSDPPRINIGTLNQRCSDCHILFQNTRVKGRELRQHTEIELRHGSNDGCLNCHDQEDRERLALRGGETVGYGQVELLCAQCHGPIYRDWGKGVHGKTLGYWNTDLGPAVKLTCTQCHDPHAPAYDPMEPLRGPNTLRMGHQRPKHLDEMINDRNPLQRWRLLENESPNPTQTEGEH